jgi:hypothetical protein
LQIDQVRLTGPDDDFASGAEAQSPLTLLTTLGALPAPCEVTCVVRVHVPLPLLTETTLTLFAPAGISP